MALANRPLLDQDSTICQQSSSNIKQSIFKRTNTDHLNPIHVSAVTAESDAVLRGSGNAASVSEPQPQQPQRLPARTDNQHSAFWTLGKNPPKPTQDNMWSKQVFTKPASPVKPKPIDERSNLPNNTSSDVSGNGRQAGSRNDDVTMPSFRTAREQLVILMRLHYEHVVNKILFAICPKLC